MYKTLAIIPARSGSKGLENKNILELNGVPLLGRTIQVSKESQYITKVIVSSDSEEYLNVASQFNPDFLDKRPTRLSTDTSSAYELISYIFNLEHIVVENFDIFILLQPTSPFRTSEDIDNAFKIFFENAANSVVSISKFDKDVRIINKLKNNSLYKFIKTKKYLRRQDSSYYYINGAIYIMKIKEYIKWGSFYMKKSYPYIMDKLSSLDIDDIYDFEIAKVISKGKLDE